MLTSERAQARAAAHRAAFAAEILPAVETLLASGATYNSLSLKQISESAGVSRSTVYRHFEDKIDLLLALSEPALRLVTEVGMRAWQPGPDVTRSLLERDLGRTIDAYLPHVPLLRALIEASEQDERVREQYSRGFEAAHAQIADRLREGQRDGYVRPDLYPWETAGWLLWMADRGVSQLASSPDAASRQRFAESLAGIIWQAVYAL